MKPLVAAALATCTFAIGLGVGWWSARPAGPPVAPLAEPVAATAVPVRATPSPAPDAVPVGDDALLACQQQLEAATAFLDAQRESSEGTPREFPDDLPPAYTPEGFQANAAEVEKHCDLGEASVSHADCREFPCMLVLDGDGANAVKACSWWSERYPEVGMSMANGSIHTPEGVRRYSMLGGRPPGSAPIEDGGTRTTHRFDVIRNDLMVEWDGYEPTAAEQRAASIAHWEEIAAQGGEGAEMAEQMLEMLRSQ